MITKQSFYRTSSGNLPDDSNRFLYIDIETTGLSAGSSMIYMIGCGYLTGRGPDRGLTLIQWFNDDAVSEEMILKVFRDLLAEKERILVTFNGDSFDLPYLRQRFQLLDLPLEETVRSYPSIDLYRILKPFRNLFGLPRGRQKDWEIFMGISREDTMSGRDLIKIYKNWLAGRDPAAQDMLFLHNYEDICHLYRLSPLMALADVTEGAFLHCEARLSSRDPAADEKEAVFSCFLKTPLPMGFTLKSSRGKLTACKDRIMIKLPPVTDSMKHFFRDYNNYYYLPLEDRAIHKSVGIYVEKQHRRKCSASDCYVKKYGVFLPLPNKMEDRHFTSFRPDYSSQEYYVEIDELLSAAQEQLREYLAGQVRFLLFSKKLRDRTVTQLKD